jgi:hypothetical protein
MTFAAPLFAWIGGVAAAAVVGLHLLAWRRPPETPLPTARFAPERPIRMVSRALRPADLLLLALRAAVVLLAGFALAGPRFEQRRVGSARVVVADRSNGVRATGDVVAAARRELRSGDALVVFDSSAHEFDPASLDSMVAGSVNAPGSLSPALIAAIRAARRLEKTYDSVEIVLVSPFVSSELDAAASSIRSLWGGPMRRVRVASSGDSAAMSATPDFRGEPSDGLIAAVMLNGAVAGGARVRVVRDSLSASDSVAAREGRTIVVWPRSGGARWARRARVDTAMAVTTSDRTAGARADNATVVAAFQRAWNPPDGRVVARWADGKPAATEASLGAGCVRTVAIDVPAAGDLAVTPSFRRFARRMTEPCGSGVSGALSDSVLDRAIPATLTRPQAAGFASNASDGPASRMTAWLLAVAIAVMIAEQFVRRRGTYASA